MSGRAFLELCAEEGDANGFRGALGGGEDGAPHAIDLGGGGGNQEPIVKREHELSGWGAVTKLLMVWSSTSPSTARQQGLKVVFQLRSGPGLPRPLSTSPLTTARLKSDVRPDGAVTTIP